MKRIIGFILFIAFLFSIPVITCSIFGYPLILALITDCLLVGFMLFAWLIAWLIESDQ